MFKCTTCGKVYDDPGDGFCPDDGDLLQICAEPVSESTAVSSEETIPRGPQGANGLGIVVMDLSGSMTEPAFVASEDPAYSSKSKLEVMAHAFGSAIQELTTMSNAENAYVAVIGFSEKARVLGLFRVSEMKPDWKYWTDWVMQQIGSFCTQTNITEALKLARKLYDGALKGDLTPWGIQSFAPLYHTISIGSDIVEVPNIRVFLYSDGEHNVGNFENAFDKATLVPNMNVSGLITAFFGNIGDPGDQTMQEIAGICPIHNFKGFFWINNPKAFPFLRNVIHMTTTASGFCAECAKEGRTAIGRR
ncbi:MAG: VWA domain-containing protein [candidate division WOR-3 bacterium]